MLDSLPPVVETRSQLLRDRRRSRYLAWMGVTGEVLLTAGVIVQLFWLWHVALNDYMQGWWQAQAASEVSAEWQEPVVTERVFGKAQGTSIGRPDVGPPPISRDIAVGQAFATLYVPRFGDDYARAIGESVDPATVLNSYRLGLGRYSQTSWLGEVGNTAIAGHRNAYGGSLSGIADLRLGDRLYVETEAGWYVYLFRNLEYVRATDIDVLNPIPRVEGIEAGDRLLTLTSCNPRFSDAERIIAYAVYDTWYPRENGVPSEIAHLTGGGI